MQGRTLFPTVVNIFQAGQDTFNDSQKYQMRSVIGCMG